MKSHKTFKRGIVTHSHNGNPAHRYKTVLRVDTPEIQRYDTKYKYIYDIQYPEEGTCTPGVHSCPSCMVTVRFTSKTAKKVISGQLWNRA